MVIFIKNLAIFLELFFIQNNFLSVARFQQAFYKIFSKWAYSIKAWTKFKYLPSLIQTHVLNFRGYLWYYFLRKYKDLISKNIYQS